MFRFEKKLDLRYSRNFPKHLRLSVDTFDQQDFNKNDAGWIRNTISELSRCTSRSQYEAVASRLVELAGKGDVNPDLTVEEQFALVKPRYAQSSIEIANYLEMTNGIVSGRIEKAYQSAVKDKQVKPVEPSASPTIESASE